MFKNLISDYLAFSMNCKDCEFTISCNGNNSIDCLVEISEHIEKYEHTKFELEIYDFDLAFVKETKDIVKSFDEIDDSYTISSLELKLRNKGYEDTDTIIKNALKNEILYLEDIVDTDAYVALTIDGELLWNLCDKSTR